MNDGRLTRRNAFKLPTISGYSHQVDTSPDRFDAMTSKIKTS